MKRTIAVYAPATIANLGAGFDVLGVAIGAPGDVVVVERRKEPGLSFSVKPRRAGVPLRAADNLAGHVALLMMKEFRPSFGIRMTLHKRMPVGSGLGSSAASSVASAVAVNEILGRPVARKELLPFAMEGERKATGSAHADNAAPCLLGGACLIRSYDPLDAISIPLPKRSAVIWIVARPHAAVRTEEARTILPRTVPLGRAIRQWGNVGGLVVGLMSGDARLIGRSMEDVVAEPVRARLIRGFEAVRSSALAAGADGCSISGSGPSIVCVAADEKTARAVGAAMKKAFLQEGGVKSDLYISRSDPRGARVIPSAASAR